MGKKSGIGTTSRLSGRCGIEHDEYMRVLDASIAVKWFKPDEKSEAADLLLVEHVAGNEIVFAPILLLYEFANALHYSKKLPSEGIIVAIENLLNAHLMFVNPDSMLLSSTLMLAKTAHISVYDASYIALAQQLQRPLFTADAKLFRAAGHLVKIGML